MKNLPIILIFVSGLAIGMGVMYVLLSKQSAHIQKVEIFTNATSDNEKKVYVSNKTENSKIIKETKINHSTEEVSNEELEDTIREKKEIESEYLFQDSLSDSKFEIENEIVIKKEKLISSSKYTIQNLDYDGEESRADSLLGEKLKIRDNDFSHLLIEFWQSPLSSKGYVFLNNKLKLYGLDPQLTINVFKKNDQIFLSTDLYLYSIYPSEEFQKFTFANKSILK